MAKDFIKGLLDRTSGLVYFGAYPNDKHKKERKEENLFSRDLKQIKAWVKKNDIQGNDVSIYYCVAGLKASRRVKANFQSAPALFADVDLKDLDLTREQVLERLMGLEYPPSEIVDSGNGYHPRWYVDRPYTAIEEFEANLKLVGGLVAGDAMVMQGVALLRLPGTHNSKAGAWKPVAVLPGTGRVYSRDELEAWARRAVPVILRRGAKAKVLNVYERMAEEQGYKAPIDVEARLAAMTYHGEGDSAVHETQLRVTAALMARGMPKDEIVDIVMEATERAMHEAGESWNLREERAAISRMCRDYVKKWGEPEVKKPTPAKPPKLTLVQGGAGEGNALRRQDDEDEDDEEPAPRGKKKSSKERAHIVHGEMIIQALRERDEDILYTQGAMWRYQEGMWSMMTEKEEKRFIEMEVEKACRGTGTTSTQKLVGETRAWIARNPDVHHGAINWDSYDGIPTRSGLINLHNMTIEPMKPDHYSTYRIDCQYDPEADCPTWKQMLIDAFPDPLERDLLQEVLGAALMRNKPKNLMRALVLVGPSNSGKSNILNGMSELFTKHPNATSFKMMESSVHGTMEFLKPLPWVLHEAFDQSSWQQASDVKAILSGDPISINVKQGAITQHRFKFPVFWGANGAPQFKESSKAMENRMLIIRCKKVFDSRHPVGAAVTALAQGYSSPSEMVDVEEKAGLLNWAIEGQRRLLARGHYVLTAAMESEVHQMRTESNPVSSFLEDCTFRAPDVCIRIPDFVAAFHSWWTENEGTERKPPSNRLLGKQLSAIGDEHIGIDSMLQRSNKHKYFVGVGLNETGMDFFRAYSSSQAAQNNADRISLEDEVNRTPYAAWEGKDFLTRVREAHRNDPVADVDPRTVRPIEPDPIAKKAGPIKPKLKGLKEKH
jgi:P4 family phage/plasmid primase-like protien